VGLYFFPIKRKLVQSYANKENSSYANLEINKIMKTSKYLNFLRLNTAIGQGQEKLQR
jgi:hypothetical protein